MTMRTHEHYSVTSHLLTFMVYNTVFSKRLVPDAVQGKQEFAKLLLKYTILFCSTGEKKE